MTEGRCGAQSGETAARTAGFAAMQIYANELAGREVFNDKHQVESFGPLLSALARDDRAAIKRAVTSLVYSHTHVVRLRVSRGGQVLADVGGPYILAPVHGVLRRNGTTLAHYVLSVQDDLGFVKLADRFIGVPIVLRVAGHTLAIHGALSPAPSSLPADGAVSYRGVDYHTFSFVTQAFPSGALHITLLVPTHGTESGERCAAVKLAEVERIAERTWQRAAHVKASIGSFIGFASRLTGAEVFVRAGARRLGGSHASGPSALPAQGAIRYRGSGYRVESFSAPYAAGHVRIYLLVHV